MRLSGASLNEVAKAFGVSKQAVQYHESKEQTRELRRIVLQQAAEWLVLRLAGRHSHDYPDSTLMMKMGILSRLGELLENGKVARDA